jgi:membrane fusion protein, multidrug efflux system
MSAVGVNSGHGCPLLLHLLQTSVRMRLRVFIHLTTFRAPQERSNHPFTTFAGFDFTFRCVEALRFMNRRSVIFQNPALRVLVIAFALGAAAGCGKKAAGGPPPGAMATIVVTAVAKLESIAETLAVVGTLAPNESVEVKSEVEGVVEEIAFNEGQAVKKGDLLVRLDETKFRAALQQAEANLQLSKVTFDRTRQLVEDKTISPQEFDQAAATYHASEAAVALRRRELKDSRIVAPFAGVVGSRNVSPGQVISKNTTLIWVVDFDTVKAEFAVPERFISEVKAGQQIELRVAAFPSEKFKGEVYFLAPQVDPNTRTLLVKARVPNSNRKLRPGMFANLDLTLKLRENTIVVPESALLNMGDRTAVYVVGPDSTAQLRPIKVGLRMPNQMEVLTGLKSGEVVVTEGLQKVRPGGAVKLAAPPSSDNSRPRS